MYPGIFCNRFYFGKVSEYKNKDRRLKTMQDIVKINQNDNVAVALRPLNEGETLDVAGEKVTLVRISHRDINLPFVPLHRVKR